MSARRPLRAELGTLIAQMLIARREYTISRHLDMKRAMLVAYPSHNSICVLHDE